MKKEEEKEPLPDPIQERQVIWQDNHLIAVQKYAGTPTQGDDSGDVALFDQVKAYVKIKYDKPGDVYLGLLHRLDRPVSGLILFARTSKAASRLSEAFRERKVVKQYLAVVEQRPPEEEMTLVHHIRKDTTENKAYCYDKKKKDTKEAILHLELLQESGKQYLLLIKPETGRPHQIRSQLAHIGCVIVGDTKYGSSVSLADRSLCLHSFRLEFEHPTKGDKIQLQSMDPDGRFWRKWDFRAIN